MSLANDFSLCMSSLNYSPVEHLQQTSSAGHPAQICELTLTGTKSVLPPALLLSTPPWFVDGEARHFLESLKSSVNRGKPTEAKSRIALCFSFTTEDESQPPPKRGEMPRRGMDLQKKMDCYRIVRRLG